MGPGQYSPERGDSLTKTRVKTVNMASSPARPASFAQKGGADVAPGQYDDGIRFNSNTKSFTIGEKRMERVVETMGPGQYSPERGESLTKTRVKTVNIASSPARPATFAKKGDFDVGPGQYDDGK